jgi:hypothetical protein
MGSQKSGIFKVTMRGIHYRSLRKIKITWG